MLPSVVFMVSGFSCKIADGDATVKQIRGTSDSDRSSDLLENDVFSVIGGEDAKPQSKLLNLGLNFLSQESALCVGARQKSMRYSVTRQHKKINQTHDMVKTNMKREDWTQFCFLFLNDDILFLQKQVCCCSHTWIQYWRCFIVFSLHPHTHISILFYIMKFW